MNKTFKFKIKEIFKSFQGEGLNVGKPCIFIRFYGCNLICSFCDEAKGLYKLKTLDEIIFKISQFDCKNIIITGGEPTLQDNLNLLIKHLKRAGYWAAIETNGVINSLQPHQLDYITISPKRDFKDKYTNKRCCNEIRLIHYEDLNIDEIEFIENNFIADNYYLSPIILEGFNSVDLIKKTINFIDKLNSRKTVLKKEWKFSFQYHKILGIK